MNVINILKNIEKNVRNMKIKKASTAVNALKNANSDCRLTILNNIRKTLHLPSGIHVFAKLKK